MPDMKECFKTHMILHSITGLGVGLLLAGLVPSLAAQGTVLGIIVILAGVVGEFVFLKKK